MVLTRAKNQPGPDGVVGDDPSTPRTRAPTTSRTRPTRTRPGSTRARPTRRTPSHQVFLRDYDEQRRRQPVATGELLEGDAGGMATWADVKAAGGDHARHRSSRTTTCSTSRCSRPTSTAGSCADPHRGLPQYRDDRPASSRATSPTPVDVPDERPAHRRRVPRRHRAQRGAEVGDLDQPTPATPTSRDAADGRTSRAGTYDDEMLDAHFIAGDGRVNENIALTAIHQVFHSEHNRLVGHIKDVLTTTRPTRASPRSPSGSSAAGAGRLERRASLPGRPLRHRDGVPAPRVRGVRAQDPAGHQPVQRLHAVRHRHQPGDQGRVRARGLPLRALDADRHGVAHRTRTARRTTSRCSTPSSTRPPTTRTATGRTRPEQAAGSIAMGMTDQVGNELDEFVTETLRNNLLGLPLDLPTINMTRAREAGVPSLNNFRKEIYRQTQRQRAAAVLELGRLRPRASSTRAPSSTSWRPTASTRRSRTPTHDRRQARAAQVIYDNDAARQPGHAGGRRDFVNSTGAWANADGSVRDGPRRRRPLDRRPRRVAEPVRRPARLDVQLRLRAADDRPAGRRPALLPARGRPA